jgi:hypothetical protein
MALVEGQERGLVAAPGPAEQVSLAIAERHECGLDGNYDLSFFKR